MAAIYLGPAIHSTPEMLVGALVDLGAKPSALEWELSKLDLPDYHLHFERVGLDGRTGVAFSIHAGATHREHDHDEPESSEEHEHHHDDDSDSSLDIDQLQNLIERAELSSFVKGCLASELGHGGANGASAIPLEHLVPYVLLAVSLEQLGVERIFPDTSSESMQLPEWLRRLAPDLCAEPAPAPATVRIGIGIDERENRLVCRLA
jgi:hypothetical protein